MTREHAKALLPFITAYAEGKTIQVYDTVEQKWFDVGGDSGYTTPFAEHPASYRIKPEPKLVPMTSDDFPPGMIWLKTQEGVQFLVTAYHPGGELETERSRTTVESYHDQGVVWSTDRKTWHSLMKEATE